jgi:hypothetical protein
LPGGSLTHWENAAFARRTLKAANMKSDFFNSIGKERSVTASRSCSFDRPVLLRKQPVVSWVSMASHRPKLPLEILRTTSAMVQLPDIVQVILPNGSILVSSAAGLDPEPTLKLKSSVSAPSNQW